MTFDYRTIILNCYQNRKLNNPQYSLRAFARDIHLSAGQLSLVIQHKKGLSLGKAKKIFNELNVDSKLVELALLQIQAEHSRKKKVRTTATLKLQDLEKEQRSLTLSHEATEIFSDWRHFAILQALSLQQNQAQQKEDQIKWLTQKMSVSVVEVKKIIDRLMQFELLEIKNDRFFPVHETVLSSNGVPSSALRNYHRNLINKALHGIDTQSIEERILSAAIIPIRKQNIKEISKDIFEFQKMMMKKYGRVEEKDGNSVYTLALQFFKLMEADHV